MTNKKENLIILIVILFSRISFLFIDAIFSSQIKNIDSPDKTFFITENDIYGVSIHSSANEFLYKENDDKYFIEKQDSAYHYQKIEQQNKQDGLESKNLNLKEVGSNLDNNIDMLEKIYNKTKSDDVLKILVDKLLLEYQFEKAKTYIGRIDVLKNLKVDLKSYLYLEINTLSIVDTHSMNKFLALLDQMKYKSLISSDDYLLYHGLAKIWSKDYLGANNSFKQIKSPIYDNFIKQINDSINNFNNQKGVPGYYKDSLMALVCMKNGYFSIANKLAVESILEDNKYILPYQILAYSNFLTNNLEKAIENFYELNSLDIENKDKYNFYIGVSEYRLGDYQKSILTLSQLINNSKYKLDAYRYLLLNYQKLEDEERMVQIRQKLLGQNNLKESDFKSFYDNVFYQPFSKNIKHNIYKKYRQISYDYVSICYEKFGQSNDTCLYGEIGLDIVNDTRQDVENNLLYLSEKYPQSHIFQALGDYYRHNNLDEKAKTYYLKAISLTENISQKSLIEQHLADTIN